MPLLVKLGTAPGTNSGEPLGSMVTLPIGPKPARNWRLAAVYSGKIPR